MIIVHNCPEPDFRIPSGVSYVIKNFRCPECGQLWEIKMFPNGCYYREKVWFYGINIRKIKWKRRMRKVMKNG